MFQPRFWIPYWTGVPISCQYGTYWAVLSVSAHGTLRCTDVLPISVLYRTSIYCPFRAVRYCKLWFEPIWFLFECTFHYTCVKQPSSTVPISQVSSSLWWSSSTFVNIVFQEEETTNEQKICLMLFLSFFLKFFLPSTNLSIMPCVSVSFLSFLESSRVS